MSLKGILRAAIESPLPWRVDVMLADGSVISGIPLSVHVYEGDDDEIGLEADDVILDNVTGSVIGAEVYCFEIDYAVKKMLDKPLVAEDTRVILTIGRFLRIGVYQ